jgi:hypothetical protein
LLGDGTAEHVPGCNLAIRRDALLAIGGFDRAFTRAGDDVDVCWRLQARGGRIAFAPHAVVWHRHRASLTAFWKQQVGYGEGEAWLMPRHPDKFASWRIVWHGRIYSELPVVRSMTASRRAWIVHTVRWQVAGVTLMTVGALLTLAFGPPSGALLALPGIAAVAATAVSCAAHAARTNVDSIVPRGGPRAMANRIVTRATIAALHFMQPLARRAGWLRGFASRGATG